MYGYACQSLGLLKLNLGQLDHKECSHTNSSYLHICKDIWYPSRTTPAFLIRSWATGVKLIDCTFHKPIKVSSLLNWNLVKIRDVCGWEGRACQLSTGCALFGVFFGALIAGIEDCQKKKKND